MFHAHSPLDAAAFATSHADPILDDEFFDPAEDDALDRCLFEFRQSLADFRNL